MRFRELEGMRAYLALLVTVGHCLEFTPFYFPRPIAALLHPGYAVQSFMILSGFVITHLLLGKSELYHVYVVRRAARLLPILIVALIGGWATSDWLRQGVAALPWAGDRNFVGFVQKWQLRGDLLDAQPLAHWIAHLTMLHGTIPEHVLPQASRTILAPAWSISLEWQFYLLAPLVLWFLKRGWGWLIVAAGIFAGLALMKTNVLGTFDQSFFGASSVFLILGMVSRMAVPALVQIALPPGITAVAASTAVLLFAKIPLELLPWSIVFPYLVDAARTGESQPIYRWILANPVALTIGRASYSVYLIHYVILSAVVFLATRFMPQISKAGLLAMLLASIPVIVLLSLGTYRWVERNGITLGHLWAQRSASKALDGSTAPAA